MKQILEKSFDEADLLKDEYVSTEHIFLAMLDIEGHEINNLLKQNKIERPQVLEAMKNIRGAQRITDQNPETA